MKRRSTSTPDRPVLDEESFQRLLAAAHVLQEHNDRLRAKEPQADYNRTLSEIVETQRAIQNRHLDLNAASTLIAERAQKITHAAGAAVGVMGDDHLVYRGGTGSVAGEAGTRVPLDDCLSADCLRNGQTLICADVRKDSRLRPDQCREWGVKALIAVPVHHEGKVAGVLELHFAETHSFQEHDVRTCQLMAGLVTEAIAGAAEMDWKQALAAERATMLEALERIKPQLERLAVIEPAAHPEKAVVADEPPARPVGEPPVERLAAIVEPTVLPEKVVVADRPPERPVNELPVGKIAAPSQPVVLPAEPPADHMEPAPTVAAASQPAKPKRDTICRGCGHQFGGEEFFCGICGTARWLDKPDNSIQSKWASLWRLQQTAQKQGKANAVAADQNDEATYLSPSALEDMTAQFSRQARKRERIDSIAEHEKLTDAPLPAELEEIVARYSAHEEEAETTEAESATETEEASITRVEAPLRIVPAESVALSPAVPSYPWTSARKAREWLESLRTQQPSRAWWIHQWHRQRANIYLGIAALVLLGSLMGWGTRPAGTVANSANTASAANSRRRRLPPPPELTLFEKLLVGLGLAEPPPTPAYLGNPDTRVWVDLRTALYYCPGNDLYGKTPMGKFTTQSDAEADQFEPAYRRVCD